MLAVTPARPTSALRAIAMAGPPVRVEVAERPRHHVGALGLKGARVARVGKNSVSWSELLVVECCGEPCEQRHGEPSRRGSGTSGDRMQRDHGVSEKGCVLGLLQLVAG